MAANGNGSRSWHRALVVTVGLLFVLAAVGTVWVWLSFDRLPRWGSEAMAPTLRPGDRILARHISGAGAHRGDIVVFRSPDPRAPDREITRISRVIAVGGDHIDTVAGRVQINGRLAAERYLRVGTQTVGLSPQNIPAGTAFLMGDNRENSRDSRADDSFPLADIRARVDYVNFPLDWISVAVTAAIGLLFGFLIFNPILRRRRVTRQTRLAEARGYAS